MKLLLDTHVWLWALHQPNRLTLRARRELESPKNELYLSPLSIWEAHHLATRKKLKTQLPFTQWLEAVFRRIPLREAALTFAVASEASRINLPQSDLGDVFIAATASAHGLTLVTSDAQLLELKWLKTLAAK